MLGGAPTWSGTGVALGANNSAIVTIARDKDVVVSLENHAATSTAGISLQKAVAGEAKDAVSEDLEFPVTATWVDSAGETQVRELLINAQTPVSLGVDLPAGTEVTLTEGDRPDIDTVEWGSITISGEGVTDNGDGSATIIVSDQQDDVSLITVVNEATWAPGTFSIAKNITGVLLDHADVPETVTVVATWANDEGEFESKELELPTDGTQVEFGEDLPHLTTVMLTEAPLEGSPSFTWDIPTWAGEQVSVLDDGSVVLTIGAAIDAQVTLTNNATPTLTSLAITKELSGTGAEHFDTSVKFPVTATWTDILGVTQSKELEIAAGETVVIDDIPVGVQVQITESEFEVAENLKWLGANWTTSAENVELAEDTDANAVTVTLTSVSKEQAQVELINEFEFIPQDTTEMPQTGFGMTPGKLIAIIAGLVVLVGGGIFLVVRNNRKK